MKRGELGISLLGPVEVTRAGVVIRIGGAKPRLILAMLALQVGKVVSVDALTEALWQDNPPATAMASLQTHISSLRRVLDTERSSSIIVNRPPGYVLDLDPSLIDVNQFRRYVTDGRALAVEGHDIEASAQLRNADALWRGAPLADLRGEYAAIAPAAALEDERLSAIETRVTLDLRRGAHAEVVAELRTLVGEFPLREDLWASFMLALYRSGRQGDALAAYQQARAALVEQLGIDPGSALQEVERAVLEQSPDLDWRPAIEARPADGVPVGRVPLPAVLSSSEAGGFDQFVGRAVDLARLMERFDKLQAGAAEVVMVSGDAGIGKTRLCAEFARNAYAAGATVLYGRCDEDLLVPYQPWIEAITQLVRNAPQLVSETDGCELASLIPAVREVLATVGTSTARDPETERYLRFGAVANVLAAASAVSPLLVVLDDLHWADRSTLMLLRHLVSSPTALRVLVLATYRSSDIRRGDALSEALATLWRGSAAERIDLAGLDHQAVVSMLMSVSADGLDADAGELARALRRETEGNPFFTREILRHLAETGAIFRDDEDRWRASSDLSETRLPASVREVVGQRVARLGDDTQRVLSSAAVIGRDFDLELLAGVTDRSEDSILDLFDDAIAAAVIEEMPNQAERFTFAHALIHRTLYEDLSATRRGRLHRRVAETLEEMCGSDVGDRVGELAHHWAAATAPIQGAKAADYATRAGEHALVALAPDEAVRWFSQALDLIAVDSTTAIARCDVLIGLGTAQLRTGDPAHRQTLFDAASLARAARDVDRLVTAALANHRGWQASSGEVDTGRVEVLTAALEAIDVADTPSRARLLATLSVELAYSGDRARISELADGAVALARRLDDPAILVHALNAHHQALRLPDTLADRLVTTAEAVAIAENLGDPRSRFSAHQQRLQAAIEAGDGDERNRHVKACHDIADRIREPFMRWVDFQNRATQAVLDGELALAEVLAEEAFAIGTESGQPDALMIYGVQLLDIRINQGRTAEVADLVASGLDDNPGLPALRAAVARAYLEAERPDDARALLEGGFDLPGDDLWLVGTSMWAQIAASLGSVEIAAELYERLASWSGQIPTAVVVSQEPVDHCLGELAAVLGQNEAARAHFEAAEQTARRFGAPFFIARTLVESARLDATVDRQLGTAKLATALELCNKHGYARVGRAASTLLTQ